MLQDLLLEPGEFGRWFEPSLDELTAPALVHGERVCVASGAVQRLHQKFAGVLTFGMLADERLEICDNLVVLPAGHRDLCAAVPSSEAELLEPYGFSSREITFGELDERRSPPQRQGLLDAVVAEKALEQPGVDLVGPSVELVPALLGGEILGSGAESASQPGDLRTECRRGIGGE